MTDPFKTMFDSTRGCSLASRIKVPPTIPTVLAWCRFWAGCVQGRATGKRLAVNDNRSIGNITDYYNRSVNNAVDRRNLAINQPFSPFEVLSRFVEKLWQPSSATLKCCVAWIGARHVKTRHRQPEVFVPRHSYPVSPGAFRTRRIHTPNLRSGFGPNCIDRTLPSRGA